MKVNSLVWTCVQLVIFHFTTVAPLAQPLQFGASPSELGVTLRQINSVGTFMMVTAHPDDENNALLTLFSKGKGHRTVLLTATRGDGGQNEIGAELFDGLAVLRSEELLAAHRLDGAEQFFTRAVDFGYSFSVEETFSRWGRQEILGDMVRMIRTVRPDVVSAMSPDGRGGGQHHQASAILAHEAYHAAADPSRFPDQLSEDVRPWQVKKFYFSVGFPFGFGPQFPGLRQAASEQELTTVNLGDYDELLGSTYAEVGSRARGMHKCQGMSQLVALPASQMGARFRLEETVIPTRGTSPESSLFDGIDTAVGALAVFAGPRASASVTDGLSEVALHALQALQGFEREGAAGARDSVVAGLRAVQSLRSQLSGFELDDDGRFEIDFRLAQKEQQFRQAVLLTHGIRLEALANDGVVIPGQELDVSLLVANQGEVQASVRGVRLSGVENSGDICENQAVNTGLVYSCSRRVEVPSSATTTDIHWTHEPTAARYVTDGDVPFGAPFRPTPFLATFDLDFGDVRFEVEEPIEFRYSGDIFAGEKRMALTVVPHLTVELTPEIAIIPTGQSGTQEVRVTVTNAGPSMVDGAVNLILPSGWQANPTSAPVRFSRQDESQTVRFEVSTNDTAVGEYSVGAVVTSDTDRFSHGYRVVEYPHIGRRHLGYVAESRFKLLDVSVAPDLSVGYVVGVGDAVPPAIEQLGVSLDFLDEDDLAWSDLSRFDVIVTGVRAYERRADLRAHNDRLLAYVESGGTVIVQYNKFEFNQAQYGPYPAQVSRNRVTDELAPIELLANDHQVFAWPNRIGPTDWDDWVQERGLYFLGERDDQYVDLVQLEDSFDFNPGIKRGALVEARVGRGRWLYVGLGLWRQLPAGTSGAYALLANLISLGQTEP